MRPHETFHEANRRFFPCEVFRAPLYHVVPLDAIMGTCCVMDLATYCKVSTTSIHSLSPNSNFRLLLNADILS